MGTKCHIWSYYVKSKLLSCQLKKQIMRIRSSAKAAEVQVGLLKEIELMNNIKTNGPKSDPWGTPKLTFLQILISFLILFLVLHRETNFTTRPTIP